MPFDIGAVVPLGAEVRDDSNQLANAGSMALTIALPDGTSVSVSPVTPTSTGVYAHDYTTTQAGRHTVRWVATGLHAGAYTDSFDVRETTPPTLLSLADAKRHLNKSGSADDDEVRAWIEATTRAVEFFVGPVVVRTVTETHDALQARALVLRERPVLELVSVVPVRTGGATVAVDGLDVDEHGIVRRLDGGYLCGPLRVTYTAGRRVITANITAAARIILQHLWRTQMGPGRTSRGSQDFDVTEPIPGLGYAIPNRAVQLLNPDSTGPGVA